MSRKISGDDTLIIDFDTLEKNSLMNNLNRAFQRVRGQIIMWGYGLPVPDNIFWLQKTNSSESKKKSVWLQMQPGFGGLEETLRWA